MSGTGSNLKRDGLAFVLVAPLLVGLTPSGRTAAFAEPRMAAVASDSQAHDLSALPLAAQASISAVLGRDDARYQVIAQGDRLHAENPSQALAADFTPRGVELRTETARWGMALRGYGYGQALRPVSAAAPKATANRVEYRRSALTEWYENGPLGLEQGFTLEAPPGAPRPEGELLTLALDVSGDVRPVLDANGAGVTLQQADGRLALRYAGLSVHDSAGRGLPAWLEMQGEAQLRLRVDDAGSHYPLTIDPLVQTRTEKAKLMASDGAAEDRFGWSVAISGDTVVVGAYLGDVGGGQEGSAYVFVEPAGGWSDRRAEKAKLTASDGVLGDEFGYSVTIDGDTVVVGARHWRNNQGSAYVFVEPAGGWAGDLTETAKLTASDGEGGRVYFDEFGWSVVIGGDTVVVGAPHKWPGGFGYLFVEPAGGWAGDLTEAAKLTSSDPGWHYFGTSVAISDDTVVVGAGYDYVGGAAQGSAYVFVEPAGGWAGDLTEAAKLTASDGAESDYFGLSVAISGDTVVVGAYGHDVGGNWGQGSAYVFVEPAGGWAGDLTETAKLTASDGATYEYFGCSVAISGDTVVVGAYNDHVGGSAYVFVEPAGGWAGDLTESAKLRASDGDDHAYFGWSVAISGDTVVVGAYGDDVGANENRGSAYVFVRRTRSAERR